MCNILILLHWMFVLFDRMDWGALRFPFNATFPVPKVFSLIAIYTFDLDSACVANLKIPPN